MKIIVHNHYHSDPGVMRRLDKIMKTLGVIEDDMGKLDDKITALETSAEAETDTVTALEKLLGDILTTIRNEGVNESRLGAVLDKLEANRARLVALALTNTNADPQQPIPDQI